MTFFSNKIKTVAATILTLSMMGLMACSKNSESEDSINNHSTPSTNNHSTSSTNNHGTSSTPPAAVPGFAAALKKYRGQNLSEIILMNSAGNDVVTIQQPGENILLSDQIAVYETKDPAPTSANKHLHFINAGGSEITPSISIESQTLGDVKVSNSIIAFKTREHFYAYNIQGALLVSLPTTRNLSFHVSDDLVAWKEDNTLSARNTQGQDILSIQTVDTGPIVNGSLIEYEFDGNTHIVNSQGQPVTPPNSNSSIIGVDPMNNPFYISFDVPQVTTYTLSGTRMAQWTVPPNLFGHRAYKMKSSFAFHGYSPWYSDEWTVHSLATGRRILSSQRLNSDAQLKLSNNFVAYVGEEGSQMRFIVKNTNDDRIISAPILSGNAPFEVGNHYGWYQAENGSFVIFDKNGTALRSIGPFIYLEEDWSRPDFQPVYVQIELPKN